MARRNPPSKDLCGEVEEKAPRLWAWISAASWGSGRNIGRGVGGGIGKRTDKPLPPSPATVLGRQDALRGDGLKGCMNRRAYNQRNVIFKKNHAPCV